jgi:putative transcriptional regulator
LNLGTAGEIDMKRSVEDRIIAGLKDFAGVLKSGKPITERFTCRTVVVDLKPTRYSSKEVKATRKLLRCSQVVFAQFLGVSPKTVRAWEQDINKPNDMACRFMDEIQLNPEYMRQRLHDSVTVKNECRL